MHHTFACTCHTDTHTCTLLWHMVVPEQMAAECDNVININTEQACEVMCSLHREGMVPWRSTGDAMEEYRGCHGARSGATEKHREAAM